MPRSRAARHLRDDDEVGFFTRVFRFFAWVMWSRALISRVVTVLIGVGYPGYQSFKAIKSANKELQERWLTYWIVFSVYSLVELALWPVLQFLPFYYEIKIALLVCLIHPKVNGASRIYLKFLKPNLDTQEKSIDALVSKADAVAAPHLSAAADKVNEQLAKSSGADLKKSE